MKSTFTAKTAQLEAQLRDMTGQRDALAKQIAAAEAASAAAMQTAVGEAEQKAAKQAEKAEMSKIESIAKGGCVVS
jgi:predicted component of type VI protein secretion system